jgi:hypothetical protein
MSSNQNFIITSLWKGCHQLPTRERLKALCLVLVISENAQVLIMCLRLYAAKND